jgi:hypothetical protein
MASKGAGVLLAALYLGAVPVVADEPAFAGLGGEDGVMRIATHDPSQWRAAFEEMASADRRSKSFARLTAYCRKTFNPVLARPTIERLLQLAAPMGNAARARRERAVQMAWRPRRSHTAVSVLKELLSSSRSR